MGVVTWQYGVPKVGNLLAAFPWTQAQRLLRPLWSYLIIMGCIAAVVTALAPPKVAVPLMRLTTQLLWFLGSYILITALTPALKRTTPMQGVVRTLSLLAVCAFVDLVSGRFP